MLTTEDIANRCTRLATHRSTLAHLLQQAVTQFMPLRSLIVAIVEKICSLTLELDIGCTSGPVRLSENILQ